MNRSHSPRTNALGVIAVGIMLVLVVVFGASRLLSTESDNPVDAVRALITAVETKQFDSLPNLVCATQKDAIRRQFDLRSVLAPNLPAGVDPDAVTSSLVISFNDPVFTKVDSTNDTANVNLKGTLHLAVDKTKMTDLIEKSLAQASPAISSTALGPMIDTLVSGFKSDQAIDVTFIVTYETGRWLVCGSSTGV